MRQVCSVDSIHFKANWPNTANKIVLFYYVNNIDGIYELALVETISLIQWILSTPRLCNALIYFGSNYKMLC